MRKKINFLLLMLVGVLGAMALVSCSGCGKRTQPTTTSTTAFTGTDESGYDYSKRGATTVYFHYLRYKGDYEGWDLWCWPYKPTNGSGKGYTF